MLRAASICRMNCSRRWLFHRELIRKPIGRRLERRSTHRLTYGRDASALSEICERLLKEPVLPPVCTENLIRVDDVMESHKLAE
jgi:hypothetical protein